MEAVAVTEDDRNCSEAALSGVDNDCVGQEGSVSHLPLSPAAVNKPTSTRLKLHSENQVVAAPTTANDEAMLTSLFEAFERATGWRLGMQRDEAKSQRSTVVGNARLSGRLTLSPAAAAAAGSLAVEQVRPLASAIGKMLGEIDRLRQAVWHREAELAAGVPVTGRPNDEAHLAERLESVLRGGAEAVDCKAAALYLLDDSTSSLKLRASWGLPQSRLLDEARPLKGAIADLEALLGHAVVLEDTSLLPHWRSPEEFPAAVCVPVSSASQPLGTLWIFGDRVRDFSPEQTNLIEIIAGRIASDLEREMLMVTGVELKKNEKQLETGARWQHDRLPSVVPILDELEVAGWTQQARGIGGAFHDWNVLPDGRLAVAVASAQGTLVEAGLNAAALHAALKSHSGYRHDAAAMLDRLNDTLWTASAGDQFAALAYALLHPESGALELALAGSSWSIFGSEESPQIITAMLPPLGSNPDIRYKPAGRNQHLAAGDFLVLLTDGARSARDEAGLRIGDAAIGGVVQRHRRDSAAGMLSRLKRLLSRGGTMPADDLAMVVVKRRGLGE